MTNWRVPRTENPVEVRQALQRLDHSLNAIGLLDLEDPDADRIIFWDDSESMSAWLTVSTGLQISTTNLTTKDSEIVHDNLSGFVANEHIDHTAVTFSAGTGLTGGGTLAANRTLSLSHLGIESLSDPGGDRILFWDDSATACKWLSLDASLSITDTTLSVVAGSVDHGSLAGLGDNDHSQYFLVADHTLATHTALGLFDASSDVDHDQTTNFVADEHIDWTNASDALVTSSTGQFSNIGAGATPTNDKIKVSGTPADSTNVHGVNVYFTPTCTNDGTVTNYALTFSVKPGVSATKTNSGVAAGVQGNCLGYSSPDLAGTLTYMCGGYYQYGQYSASGTVTNCYGIYLEPYHKSGTITNAYDIYIKAPNTGGTVTNEWSIYSANDADSYLTGALGLGVNAPDARLEVQTGTAEGKQAVTIDQNDADQAFVDFQGTSEASAAQNISTWTNSTIAGHVKIEINGSPYWIAYRDAPTS